MEDVDVTNDEGVIKKLTDEFIDLNLYQSLHLDGFVKSLAARTSGQYLIKKFHSVLWTIEKTIKWWQYRSRGVETSGIRPLPWTLFIPFAVFIRIYLFILSILPIAPMEPADLITVLQYTRRNIRSIRLQGLRDIRARPNTDGHDIGLLMRLRNICKGLFRVQAINCDINDESGDRSDFEYMLNKTYSDNDEDDNTFDADELVSSTETNDSNGTIDTNDGRSEPEMDEHLQVPVFVVGFETDASSNNEKSHLNSSANTTAEMKPAGKPGVTQNKPSTEHSPAENADQ